MTYGLTLSKSYELFVLYSAFAVVLVRNTGSHWETDALLCMINKLHTPRYYAVQSSGKKVNQFSNILLQSQILLKHGC